MVKAEERNGCLAQETKTDYWRSYLALYELRCGAAAATDMGL